VAGTPSLITVSVAPLFRWITVSFVWPGATLTVLVSDVWAIIGSVPTISIAAIAVFICFVMEPL
jgi:hypothetical protein